MPYPAYTVLPYFRPTQDRQAQRRRAGYQARHLYSCRVAAVALPDLRFVLCAPCGIRDITQKINRERNLPGINIEVVALLNIVRAGEFTVVPLFL